MRFFRKIRKRIIDPTSFGSQCIKGTNECTLEKDSSVPLMHRNPNDLGSMIRFRIFTKKRTLCQSLLQGFPPCSIDLALHLLMFWKFQISFYSYYWVIVLMSEFVSNFIQIKHFGIMAFTGRKLQSFVLLRRKSSWKFARKQNLIW